MRLKRSASVIVFPIPTATLLATGLLAVVVVSLSFCTLSCPAAPEKGSVVLEFPADRSLGVLRLYSYKRDKATGRLVQSKDQINLKGTVALPIGVTNADFKLSYDGAENIRKLADIVGKYDIIRTFDSDDQLLDNKKVAQIARISSIRRIDLAHTDLGDDGVKALMALNRLTCLNMSSTMITAQSGKYISTLSELTVLDLDKNGLDDSIGKELSKLAHIDDLGLKATNVSDACLDEVAKMKSITQLRLGSNRGITDRGIAKLVALKNLKLLDVTDTKVTPKGLEPLKSLPLKVLKVRRESWSKAQLDRLKSLFPNAELKDGFTRTDIDQGLFEPLHSPFKKGTGF
jgi:hypothetical protein